MLTRNVACVNDDEHNVSLSFLASLNCILFHFKLPEEKVAWLLMEA